MSSARTEPFDTRTEALARAEATEAVVAAQVAEIISPPSACSGSVATAGQPWPERTTARFCRRCQDRLRRVHQVRQWNADHAHQVMAGHASFEAFSSRWRAGQGLAPLSAEAVRRYLNPEHIRSALGVVLPAALQETIYRAWCAGELVGVSAWLSADPPPEPDGLWATLARAIPLDRPGGEEGGAWPRTS
jgi:hypothetical protein